MLLPGAHHAFASVAPAPSVHGVQTPGQFDAGLRNELAQLHGNANKLLATRIDAILTSELISGRDDARAIRKQLIKDVEKLIDKVEDQVKRVDRLKGH